MGFYGRLSAIADRMLAGEITQKQYCEMTVELLDEFLARHDDHADRLAIHYGGISDYLLNASYDDPEVFEDKERVEMLIAEARKEIEVFQKNGYDSSRMEYQLECALTRREEL